ncbi:hypothetical protein J9325_08695 [Lacticaseibacillus paracasei]|uniref:YopX family protein n=1 Tax=Lacticaseibacillus paracasei TaxID=1597 RepID=UPI0003558150|nr:YopX family protein [Lacticaseibacillus paracasei]AGP69162.1 Hypothetical protein LOCK919_2482 [Lacticaseibacillus paracasei]QTX17312.1 hypothetical protein J9325_08695 [Lacticaseibacillus paracasei]
MKREIKFRGLPICKEKDELDYINFDRDGNFAVGFYEDGCIIGNVAEASDEYICPEFWVAVDRNTVGQYTGLHDKNGREVYEGDIVSFGNVWDNDDNEDLDEDIYIGVVEYDPHYAVYNVNCEKSGERRFMFTEVVNYDGFGVIGNIFENPELLEGKQ